MKFAFNVPNFDPYHDPRLVAELAYEAEESGWDGFFIWDHIRWPWVNKISDPWIMLALIATRTKRIRIGALVTPVPRRHPWHLAREIVTIDHLSNGRLIVGVGIGGGHKKLDEKEFHAFGQNDEAKVRAEKLDEGLAVMTGLWTGKNFNYEGKHYQIKDTRFLPKPMQQPRPPIWVAGTWPLKAPARRAARWDGYVPLEAKSPADVVAMLAFINEHRNETGAFDLVASGSTSGEDAAKDSALVTPFAEAGATWWSEGRVPWLSKLDEVRARIRLGPPRVS